MESLDECRSIFATDDLKFVSQIVMGPVLAHDTKQSLDQETAFMQAVVSPTNWPTARARILQVAKPTMLVMPDLARQISVLRIVQNHFAGLTDRRLAVIALAIRLYRIDHHDAFPLTLDALVPNYLKFVPSILWPAVLDQSNMFCDVKIPYSTA